MEKFRNISTSNVSDSMKRYNGASYNMRPFHNGKKLLGTAFTVKTKPGDNLLVLKAINLAKEGDVIVVDAGGILSHAIAGEIMMKMAMKKNIAGFVIDGAIRDVEAIKEANFPVFAKGIIHRGPSKDGPGEINVPIHIAGMDVNPGDIIIGDEDGLVTIPRHEATEIAELAYEKEMNEKRIFEEIEKGTLNIEWIDNVLKEKGCEYIE